MNQIEVKLKVLRELEDLVIDRVSELGIEGASVEDEQLPIKYNETAEEWEILDLPSQQPSPHVIIHVFFDKSEYEDHIKKALQKMAADLSGAYGSGAVTIDGESPLTNMDWQNEWKKYYKPTKIGERLVIIPSWEEYELGAGEIPITLDPGMAFGTGTHASTSLCLELMQEIDIEGAQVLDVGCGSGILSIAAVKLGAAHVDAVDIDLISIETTVENAEINGSQDRIHAFESNLVQGITGRYRLVLANLVAEIIIRLAEDLPKVIQPGAHLVTSGILSEKAEAVEEALEKAGFSVLTKREEKGWVGILAVHR
ncbi:MAG: 50S ribosomal protein L11 methyltransferase [Tissierellia bacterium]|nr:50S ribosomal protein L11 methyltransferase [Tissierellia bacterium]